MEEKQKEKHGFWNFIKKNFYYVAVVFAVLALAGIVAISTGMNNTIEVDNGENTEKPVSGTIPTYFTPVAEINILKDYNDSALLYNDTLQRWESHKGINFGTEANAEVFAFTDGTVAKVYNSYLEGNVVVINHNNGLKSVYSSLQDDVKVMVGQNVSAGEVIGFAGSTNNYEFSGQNQLYFELFKDDVKINPSEYLTLTDK